MSHAPAGLILAALDVDVDNGAAWNRWYDLEHLAPNLALPGVITGRRYVAPPHLHASRLVDATDSVWADGRSVYLTWYATSTDPADAITAMAQRRDELEADGRMDGAGARVVRSGDALRVIDTATDPALRLDPADLAHVGHVGLRLVIDTDAQRPATLGPHVVVSLRCESVFDPGSFVELQFLDVDAALALPPIRAADGRTLVLDAGFDVIDPLRYPFLAAIVESDLPRSVEDPP